MIASITFLGLLLIPGSPAFLGVQSRIALGAWVILGIIFYMIKRKNYKKIPEKELNYYILGKEEVEIEKD